MKAFFKFILVLFGSLILIFFMWYSNVGRENLYYIEEADMYIKTFPSRNTVIIAFSNKRIGNITDSLDYVEVHKGGDNFKQQMQL